jgi:hypothetical protein
MWAAALCAACCSAIACGGDAAQHPTAPSAQGLLLTVALTVSNARFGTAVVSDFVVTVSGPSTPLSFTAGVDADAVSVMLNPGITYTVSVAGPAGYDVTRSPECSGVSAIGQKTCKVSLQESPLTCDDALWSRVYLRDRLRVLNNCAAASGIVADVGLERDGDLVMELIPDPLYTNLLRPGNLSDPNAHQHLIVEVPCQGPTPDAAPSAACAQFTGAKVAPPPLGSHIAAAAHWVEDRNHSSWGELHGARIVMLPR